MKRVTFSVSVLTVAATLTLATAVVAQQTGHPPGAQAHAAMGFDPHKATHHFLLYEDGGAVDVSANDVADKTTAAAIQSHLPHIAQMFGQGHMDAPMAVHDTKDIPGVADMIRLKDKIKYTYTQTARGGRVDVVTTDKAALAAVHAFLKFQITEHKTGDSVTPGKRKN